MSDGAKALKSGAQEPAQERANAATGGFDFAAILAVADALPMPIAYLDEEQRYRFINKAFAEFFERSRSSILGLTAKELLGDEVYAIRKPLFDAAYAGERQWFAAEFPHPTRGPRGTVVSIGVPIRDASRVTLGGNRFSMSRS